MGSDRQTLLDHLPTLVTLLTGETQVHSNDLMTSSCGLVFKDVKEGAPRGVENALGQLMIFHHVGDLKVFHSNMVILFCISLGNLEMVIAPLPVDLQMCLGNVTGGLAPSFAALLAPTQCALLAPEGLLRCAIETRIRNGVALAIGKEDLQPDINADVRMRTATWRVLCVWFGFADNQGVPMPISTMDKMYRLRSTHNLPVQLDFEEVTKLLGHDEVFLLLMQIAVFAVLPQLDTMPAVRCLEPREADPRDIVLFGSEKAFEGLREAIGKHLYGGGWDVLTLSFESRFKFIFAWECPILLIACLERLKHAIVNGARLSQAHHELAGLLFIHEQAVFKGSHKNILIEAGRKVKRQGSAQPKTQRKNACFTFPGFSQGPHRRFLVDITP